jgi:tetratricopeptide (TPR) repeat protein
LRGRALILPGLILAALLAASRPLDRLGLAAMRLDRPALAASLFRDPAWRGAALLEAGRHAEAARVLASAHDAVSLYNRGNALARTGAFPEAVAAYDEALARDPLNDDAQANRALVLSLIKPPEQPPVQASLGGSSESATRAKFDRSSDVEEASSALGEGAAGVREAVGEQRPGGGGPPRGGRRRSGEDGGRGGGAGAEAGDAAGSTREVQGEDATDGQRRERIRAEARQAVEQWIATIPDDPKRNLRIRISAEQARRAARGAGAPAGDDPW